MLDNRRYDTLQLTFKQVAKNFQEVFKKLITNGHADLVMKTTDPTLNVKVFLSSIHLQNVLIAELPSENFRKMLYGIQKDLESFSLIYVRVGC